MNVLVINCAYKTRLALLCGNGFNEVFINDKTNDNLLQHIEKLLKTKKLTLDTLDAIAICIGPGSFTGIRASVSLVKGLVAAKKINIIAFTSFDELEYNKEDYLVLEGFSNFVYTLYKGKADCKEIEAVRMDLKNNNIKALFQTEDLKTKLNNAGEIAIKKTQKLIEFKLKMANFVDLDKIEPLYLRASQAEIEREKRIKNGKN